MSPPYTQTTHLFPYMNRAVSLLYDWSVISVLCCMLYVEEIHMLIVLGDIYPVFIFVRKSLVHYIIKHFLFPHFFTCYISVVVP